MILLTWPTLIWHEANANITNYLNYKVKIISYDDIFTHGKVHAFYVYENKRTKEVERQRESQKWERLRGTWIQVKIELEKRRRYNRECAVKFVQSLIKSALVSYEIFTVLCCTLKFPDIVYLIYVIRL